MNSMFSIMDLLIAGSGLYVIYLFYLMKYKGEIKENILLPKDLPLKKCKDLNGYIAEMSPKVLIFGIVVTLSGIVGIVEDTYHVMGVAYLIMIVIFLAVTVWFVIQTRKAVKKYWP